MEVFSEIGVGPVFFSPSQEGYWVKHHPNGLLVHPAIQTENGWSAQAQLLCFRGGQSSVVTVVGEIGADRQ